MNVQLGHRTYKRTYKVTCTKDGPQVRRHMPGFFLARAWIAMVDLLSTRSLRTRASLYESDLVNRQDAFDKQHTQLFEALASAERPPLPVDGFSNACVSKEQVLAMNEMIDALDKLVIAMPTRNNFARLDRLRRRLATVATNSEKALAAIELYKKKALAAVEFYEVMKESPTVSTLGEYIHQRLQNLDVPLINKTQPQISRFEWPEQDWNNVMTAMRLLEELVNEDPTENNLKLLEDLQEEVAAMIALKQQ